MPVIYPVILSVGPEVRELPARERSRALSLRAREALRLSAERTGAVLGPLEKDGRGAPLPSQGWFWSLTHKPCYVAGVVAPEPVGVDVEPVRACSPGLYRKAATPEEWALAQEEDRQLAFFRFWTAKEAVLKTVGEGMKDLSRCRIVRNESPSRLWVDYAGRTWTVEQVRFDGHVAAVATGGLPVDWRLL
jgi:4'-phosphopantetheinyl transferase